ncbi:type I DNA topoisomerase [Mycoplasmopsis edwardii]|uniref:Type I DNA topoisomerase n=1 Tax=Mycoplasmopsis edwardii TaxID=53558 RepID=A0ACD4PHD5_9BACT|nr:type I DNA topoisomerase [Mycoplasmopsis edwardii]WBP83916.1 type I DNA topoisomerase [Mycoplasmopsis edwardii]
MKNLVIVESPNKVSTIKKYLGDDFNVIASVGHFLKMKTDGEYGLGIDLQEWEPKYSLDSTKRKVVNDIKEALKGVDNVYIATDPDREGEGIGQHLVSYFKLKNYYRIKYNEITKDAILRAISNPGDLNEGLVNAQKSRRMLDRIIGFRLSNLMKLKFKNAPGIPTAGRVQSIALKLVVDREREIQAFVPEKYFKLNAKLENNETLAYYFNPNVTDRKDWILSEEVDKVKKYFETAKKELKVTDVTVSRRKVSAITPFKQSVLYKKSPFSSSSTQVILQKLYEGFGEGGLISYPRTDSTRLSQDFINQAHKYINNKWGQEYIASEIKGFSGDQDAHEAIRPTDVYLTPEKAAQKYPEMSEQDLKVYKLIYENTLMALITQPVRESKAYEFQTGEYLFKQSFSKVVFDGYYVVAGYESEKIDPNYQKDQLVNVESFNFEDHETKPVPRYNEGSLIEMLDNIKVGRPSTFATTVKIIKDRKFVVNESSQLIPTEFGIALCDSLIAGFPNIINESYTAKVEEELDKIADNELSKNVVLEDFWNRFQEEVKDALGKINVYQFSAPELDRACPACNGVLLIRNNKKGQKFIGCKNFPKCKHTENYVEEGQEEIQE